MAECPPTPLSLPTPIVPLRQPDLGARRASPTVNCKPRRWLCGISYEIDSAQDIQRRVPRVPVHGICRDAHCVRSGSRKRTNCFFQLPFPAPSATTRPIVHRRRSDGTGTSPAVVHHERQHPCDRIVPPITAARERHRALLHQSTHRPIAILLLSPRNSATTIFF